MNLSMSLKQVALRFPQNPAITTDAGTLTYAQFEDGVARIAGGLIERLALPRASHVGIAMENCAEFLLVLYGIWRAGMVAIPMNSKLHPREMEFILSNAGARVCFCTPEIADKLGSTAGVAASCTIITAGSKDFATLLSGQAISEVSSAPEDMAWLFYTSGTTGRPKGAMLTHRNLQFMSHCYYSDVDQVDERDTKIHAAPLSHGSGLYALAHIAKGSHQIILSGSFEPERIFDVLANHKHVTMFGAPTMVSRLINHPRVGSLDTSNLKTLYYGGAPMYVSDLKRALEIFGPKLTQIYGQGESPMTITYLPKHLLAEKDNPRLEEIMASCGFARAGVEVKIVGEDGRELAVGEVGEVITRSDCVMRGYWNNPEANAKALRDGWLWTGDVGALDTYGFLTLKDRSKDMIISGGSNIYPREIEEVLLTHAAVRECAVVSRPHADWGEEVIAFVVTQPGATITDQDLDKLCLDNIARYKRPKAYRFVTDLPKNSYGKILKTDLREKLQQEA